MISSRQPIGLKNIQPEGPVSDPRRSYDRGAWAEGEGSAAEPGEAGGRRATAGELASISTDMLRRELERRRRGVESLLARRDALRAEIAELDAQIRELSDEQPRAARGRGRGQGHGDRRSARLALPRPKNAMSLPDAIAVEVEVGDSITPAEAAKRVLASGYQTTAKTFTMVVANALSKDKRFKRLGRGKYERAS
jgi:hypothetical protein